MVYLCLRIYNCFPFDEYRIFDDVQREEAKHLFQYSFSEHTLRVTDIVTGHWGCSAIIVSASEDRTCEVCHTIYLIVLTH